MSRYLKPSLFAGAVALALSSILAFAQGYTLNQLLAGTQLVPTVASTVDQTAGIYFGSKRVGISQHLETGATSNNVPTLASCGAGTLAAGSTDTAGTVTLTGVTACTVTYGTAYAVAPVCTVFDQTTNRATLTGVATASTLPITGATAGDVVSYICIARSGG